LVANTLVLSGGASKGDFEVGVLQYLYENGYFASAICSASVGSVNASQLAAGGDAPSQKAAFDTLKSIWQTEMMGNDDMYTLAPWLAGLSPRTRNAIADLYSGRIYVPPLLAEAVFCPPLLIGQIAAAGVDLNEALNGLKTAQSVFTLDPVRAKLGVHLDASKVAHSGVELRLVTVSLDSGRVRYVTQDGHVQETDGTKVPAPSPENVCTAEAAAYQVALNNYAATGVAFQKAVTSHLDRMEAEADLRHAAAKLGQAKDALDKCRANAQTTGHVSDLVVSVADGVIASSSIPCVFPPTALGDERYVDGGIRWQLPLKAALDFASDTIIAINTGILGVPRAAKSFATANLLEIAERSVFDLLLWEAEERHLELVKVEAVQQGKRVWVIAPRVDLHDGFSVDPGLIDMSLGYGYMCAADLLDGFPFARSGPVGPGGPVGRPGSGTPSGGMPSGATARGTWADTPLNAQLASLADAIGIVRRRCWELEHTAFGKDAAPGPLTPQSQVTLVPDPGALDEVRLVKTLLGLLVDARRLANGKLPAEASGWADMWELHYWSANDVPGVGDTPWKMFDSAAGVRPAAARPTALLVKRSGSSDVFLLDPTKHLIAPGSVASIGGTVQTIPDELSSILDAIPSGSPIP